MSDEPLWKRILFNEFLWAIIAILVVLAVAFHMATRNSEEGKHPPPEQRQT